jgi:hypothetical protein
MAKYEIDVNINNNTSGGSGRSRMTMQEVKEQVYQAKTLEKDRELDVKQSSRDKTKKIEKITNDLAQKLQKTINEQIRSNNALIRALESFTKVVQKIKIGGGEGGEGGGGGGKGSFLEGIRGSVSQVPIAGAALGLTAAGVAWGWHKVSEIGNAYMQKALQQLQTEQIGGFQRYGAGIYTAAELGALSKARRMQSGQFNAPGALSGESAILKYGGLFGASSEELGQIMGLLDRMTSNKGEQSLTKSLLTATRGGVKTELPLLLDAMRSTLEEAVQEGVSNSTLAEDMAEEVGILVRNGSTAPAAIAVQKNMMGVQEQVARGGLENIAQFEMYRASQEYVKRQAGAKDSAFIKQAVQQGIITEQQAKQLQEGKELPAHVQDILVRYASQTKEGDIRKIFAKNIVETWGGKTGNELEKSQKAAFFLAGNAPELFGGTPTQVMQALKYGTTSEGINIPSKDESVNKELTKYFDTVKKGGAAQEAKAMEIKYEGLLLDKTGQLAAKAVMDFNNNMIEFAKNAQDVVIPAVKALDTAMASMAKGANKLTRFITH